MKDDKNPPQRAELLPDGDPLLDRPITDESITKAWHDLGMTSKSSGFETPITWGEIESYNNLMQKGFQPWECDILHSMSVIYINYKHECTQNRALKSPFNPSVTHDDLVKRAMQADKFNTFE